MHHASGENHCKAWFNGFVSFQLGLHLTNKMEDKYSKLGMYNYLSTISSIVYIRRGGGGGRGGGGLAVLLKFGGYVGCRYATDVANFGYDPTK